MEEIERNAAVRKAPRRRDRQPKRNRALADSLIVCALGMALVEILTVLVFVIKRSVRPSCLRRISPSGPCIISAQWQRQRRRLGCCLCPRLWPCKPTSAWPYRQACMYIRLCKRGRRNGSVRKKCHSRSKAAVGAQFVLRLELHCGVATDETIGDR